MIALLFTLALGATPPMTLSSTTFEAGGAIPAKYTCSGTDVAPELHWDAPPKATVSLALVVEDPDAPGGTFVHWVLFDLPAALRHLSEGAVAPSGARHGINDFGHQKYNGPCPPPGAPHHYHFVLYALDRKLDLPAGRTVADLRAAMRGHVLAQGELIGTFGR